MLTDAGEQPETLPLLRQKLDLKTGQEITEKINVLAAEDHEINRRVFSHQFRLQEARYCLTMVKNGSEAVEEIQTNHYDIILMDNKMPVLDGISAINKIRALPDPKKSKIPIIIVSASPIDEKLCHKLGVTAMLKPYKLEELFQEIEKAITQSLSNDQVVPGIPATGFSSDFLQVQKPAELKKTQDSKSVVDVPKKKKRGWCCCTSFFGKS